MTILRKKASVFALAVGALAIGFICGCGQNTTPKKESSVQTVDPRASFESFSKSYVDISMTAILWKTYPKIITPRRKRCSYFASPREQVCISG
jgi:uncharacterized secreted protein with C-terminal beta-propeller domain